MSVRSAGLRVLQIDRSATPPTTFRRVSGAIRRWTALEAALRTQSPRCGVLGLLSPFDPAKDRSLNDDQLHFPAVPWADKAKGSHAFFHRHEAPAWQAGHFHVFRGEVHLAAIALSWKGLPIEILTLNRWVTGEQWHPAAATWEVFRAWALNLDANLCEGVHAPDRVHSDLRSRAPGVAECPVHKPGLNLGRDPEQSPEQDPEQDPAQHPAQHPGQHPEQSPESAERSPPRALPERQRGGRNSQPVVPGPQRARQESHLAGGWLAALIRSLEPELRACLHARDQRLAEAIDRKPGENVLEDRSLEVLSRCKLRWAERLDWINPHPRQSRN
ncbi:MAG: DUF6969 family protein [Betaproteobacteria bacterium]